MSVRLSIREHIQGRVARLIGRLPARVQRLLLREPPVVIDGQTLDPMLQLVRKLRRVQRAPGYCEPDVPTARARIGRQVRMYAGRPTRVAEARDLTLPGADGPMGARLYVPAGEASDALLVYLHGGGFVLCDVDSYDEICRRLCAASGARVLSVDYRLAPEHPFPAAVRDAVAALRWAQEHAPSLGADPARVSIGGDSAGGTLAAVAAHARARDGRPPATQLLIYPTTDSATPRRSHALFGEGFFLDTKDREDFARYYQSGTSLTPDDPRVSPLLADGLALLPPTLVFTAGFDILRDEGEAYATALAAAGVRVRAERFPSLAHSFLNMTTVSRASAEALERIAREWRGVADSVNGES